MRGQVSSNPKIAGGPEDFYLISSVFHVDDELKYDDSVPVDPEESHEVGLEHEVGNYAPGFPNTWTTCTTIYDETENRPLDNDRCYALDGHDGKARSHIGVGIITAPKTLRVKLWANQTGLPLLPTPPPESSW